MSLTVRASSTRDAKLAANLVDLKNHLKKCRSCSSAFKSHSPHDMCEAGMMMVLKSALCYDVVIKLRIQAHNTKDHTVFACPDISKHGQSYTLTALPMMVSGIQDRLL